MPRYFKVTNLQQESICTSRTREVSGLGGLYDFVVRYELGRWTRPNHANAKLFVFDNQIDAERFGARSMANSEGFQVWECEVENPTDRYPYFLKRVFNKSFPIWMTRLLRGPDSTLEDESDPEKRAARNANGWPRGTVFVDAVRLTRLVAVRHFDCRTLFALFVRRPFILFRRPRLAVQILARSFGGTNNRCANGIQDGAASRDLVDRETKRKDATDSHG